MSENSSPAEASTAEPQQPAEAPQEQTPEAKPVDSPEVVALRAALKKANKEAETNRHKLKEVEDRDLSEIDRAKKDAEEARTRLVEYEQANLRQKFALDNGVPPQWVDRLRGSTVDELEADWAELAPTLEKSPATPRPDHSQGARDGKLALNGDPLLDDLKSKLGIA